jgi:hypothetical protein
MISERNAIAERISRWDLWPSSSRMPKPGECRLSPTEGIIRVEVSRAFHDLGEPLIGRPCDLVLHDSRRF